MSSKTRKLIWSVPLMATLAVVGALAVFVALGLPNANTAYAQTVPEAPRMVTAASAGPMMILVTWRPPLDNGGSGITGYKVEYITKSSSPGPNDSWTTMNAGPNERNLTLDVGVNARTYVRVIATNAEGDGLPALSDPSSVVPANTTPQPPTSLDVNQGAAATEITVSWTAPTNTGGALILGYKIRIGTASELQVYQGAMDPIVPGLKDCDPVTPEDQTCFAVAGATMATIAGLSLGEEYEIQVAAVNVEGDSEYAKASELMTRVPLHTGEIYSDSSSSGAAPEIRLVIAPLQRNLPVGSSIVLFLEADYGVPSSIPPGSIYFVAEGGMEGTGDEAPQQQTKTGMAARVKATASVRIDNFNYFQKNPNDKDSRILVEIPDMCTSSTDACQGPNGPYMGQTLTMVIEDGSGITNPTEGATNYRVAFSVLGPTEAPPGPGNVKMISPERVNAAGSSLSPEVTGSLGIAAKVALSDNNNKRGYEMTVVGSGYNDGTTATAYVLTEPTAAQWWDSLDCAEMVEAVGDNRTANKDNPYCKMYAGLGSAEMTVVQAKFAELSAGFKLGANGCDVVVDNGTAIGTATIGSDDTAAIPVTVTVPTFKPGKVNYICVSDGEGRGSGADVEIFELEDRIRVVPEEVNAGDTVTLFAEDFMGTGTFFELKLGGVEMAVSIYSVNPIGPDGSATGTFVMPATIGGNPIKGIIRVDGKWGGMDGPAADTKITVKPAGLTVTKTEARANESITIQGSGFSNTSEIQPEKITIDGVALMVDADSLRNGVVRISNGGQFVATIYLWPESGTTNPALVTGTHTIRVEDESGFVGSTPLTILEPTITVVPLVAGPRDFVVIRGENFPVDNLEGGAVGAVTITVKDSRERIYSEIPDGSGRFVVEHRVSSNVAIPSVATIKASYGTEITKTGSFKVPEAIITVEPALAAPGDSLTLTVDGMPVHASVDSITIGGREALGNLNINTDRNGAVMAEGIVVPGLDPGIFSVQLEVNEIVAIGQVEVVAEGPTGLAIPLPGAMEAMGDELVRVFYFSSVDKTWSFFDPRPEFDGLNTLTSMVNGQPYSILISEDVDDVVLNNKTRNLTCVGGDCWNQLVW